MIGMLKKNTKTKQTSKKNPIESLFVKSTMLWLELVVR